MSEACEFNPVTDMYGTDVFTDEVMRSTLPKAVYKQLKKTMQDGTPLELGVADVVATAMKDWAISRGATHFCHWFQPMTGGTAEKHDSFISPTSGGRVLMEFSGKELSQGEPDASSFPSGGLRATFEARGYTAWDCTSPVFVKGNGDNKTLFVPSAFCSYTGEALDKKTPLLRSMEAIDKAAIRMLRILGNSMSTKVTATLGAEQEYFLVDEEFVERRLDLLLAQRTLFGAPSPRGQEMDDHYFGALNCRVGSFMAALNKKLWSLGISAKTQHNEVSPAQYEIAPIFDTVNVGVDRNHLTMEAISTVAREHGFYALLHEKPFAGVNGSGKHNNWSIGTDDGINLLEPGETPHENMQFLVFLFAIIRAVDKYSEVLRASVAHAGNDHRLGANEAPPAIISIFLGDQLNDIVEQIKAGGAKSSKRGGTIELGVSTLPPLPKDCTDRNRTSPFAFTGNKFEFRMAGSSQSLSGPNFVLNGAVAEVLTEMADVLEGASGAELNTRVQDLLKSYAVEHGKIIFNGDNYTAEWHAEAAKRGLSNLRNTPEAIDIICDAKNVAMLEGQKILSAGELKARQEILFEQYAMLINIEAKTSVQMAKRQIIPAVTEATTALASSVAAVSAAGVEPTAQAALLAKTNSLLAAVASDVEVLEAAIAKAGAIDEPREASFAFLNDVIPAMTALRADVDALEVIVDEDVWPLPTYADMLFRR
ncbi:MAG: glutamine synthetase III [Lentisphaeria bacterium]|nr:glutamine synthetase III [Lentisphaeria bacterium]